MTAATLNAPATSHSQAVDSARRFDIYAPIHRALRLFMTDTLGRVGWLDTSDATELAATLGQLEALLTTCQHHLEAENHFVHPAIEAVLPGGSGQIAVEHLHHAEEIAQLRAEAATLRANPTQPQALRLYRQLSLFLAENFRHMHVEETAHNQALWAHCSDDEIRAIEQRIVASLQPADIATTLRWMTPALPPAERAAWFSAMRGAMPAPVFEHALQIARRVLDDTAWAKLARALGLPPVPGLVTV